MAKVMLHDNMAEKYGSEIVIHAATGAECLRAMLIQMPEFRKDIESGAFRFIVRGEEVKGCSEQEAGENLLRGLHGAMGASDELHIIPSIGGAGSNGGVFMIIAGVIAIAAAFFTGGASIAAWGALQAGLAVGGAMMVIGGVATMMTKMPSATKAKTATEGESTSFSNVDNMTGQGNAIPLIYGLNLVGSMVVSQQIETLTRGIS